MQKNYSWIRAGKRLGAVVAILLTSASMVGAEQQVSQRTTPPYEAPDRQVRLGGYGSVKFETNDLDASNNGFDFRRFVLTLDASPAKRLHFNFELEFERFTAIELERKVDLTAGGLKVEQAIEGSNQSEISLEQAWVQLDLVPWFNLRAGAVLVPLGRFNLMHDDNRWNLPRRTLVDRGVPVLPVKSAWPELGAGIAGEMPVGRRGLVSYQLYVLNGVVLDAEVEEVAQTRDERRDKLELEAKFQPTRGPFDKDLNENKAVAGRFLFSPLLGYEVAVSGYVGEYTPDFLSDSENVWSIAVDGKVALGPVEVEGEYVFTRWNNIDGVARNFARVVLDKSASTPSSASPAFESEIEFELANLAETKSGYWLEARLPFWPAALNQTFLGRGFDNPQLIPVVRWEQVFFDDRVTEIDFAGGVLTTFDTTNDTINRVTFGLAYRPTPLWVISLAYEFTFTDSDSLSGLTNFIAAGDEEDEVHAFLVGIAFGF